VAKFFLFSRSSWQALTYEALQALRIASVVWRSEPFAGVRWVGMLAELHKCLICAVRFGKWVTWGGEANGIQRYGIYAGRLNR